MDINNNDNTNLYIYKCELCTEMFKTKKTLEKHQAKKNKCNTTTEFQCQKCQKFFKYKKNLTEHNTKNKCQPKKIVIYQGSTDIIPTTTSDVVSTLSSNKIDINSDLKLDIIESINIVLTSEFNVDEKVDLLSSLINVESSKIKIIVNSDLKNDEKLKLINSLKNTSKQLNKVGALNNGQVNNGVINTSTHTVNHLNNTTNIQINNFGKENLDYLDSEYFKDLILNNHIEKAYMKLTEDIYFHKDHPENKTIKIENLNNKYAFVYKEGIWKGILKYELKELLHNKNSQLLKVHCKKLRNILDTAKKNSISVFLARDYDGDPHLKDMNDRMVLLFYEGKPKSEI